MINLISVIFNSCKELQSVYKRKKFILNTFMNSDFNKSYLAD